MVTVVVKKSKLLELVGERAEGKELYDKLEQIKCVFEGYDAKTDALSLEVTPDRPDLLSVYGIGRGLKGALGVEKGLPQARIGEEPALKIFVSREAAAIRPVMTAAVVEGVKLGDDEIAGLFDLQEKLDFTIGRKRKRMSLGLYDLDKLKPPLYFKTADAEKTKFVPLKETKPMNLWQVVEQLPKGKEYAHLTGLGNKMPVLEDSVGFVMGLIPVINEATSAVTQETTRLLIENEGTDEHACNAALAVLCQEFAEAGARVTKAEIVYEKGERTTTPRTKPEKMRLGVAQANKMLGTALAGHEIVECLLKQRVGASVQGEWLECEIPAFRSDFLHPVDLVEEIAIGYGYNSFEPMPPSVFTKGSLSELTARENGLRDFMVGAGFLELSTYVLTNEEKIRRAKSEEEFAEVLNPVSNEYNVLRASLLPNVLEVLSENTHVEYPQRVFEGGEVVVPNHQLPERMQTKLHLCAASAHAGASLTEIASALSELAKRLGKKIYFEKLQGSRQFIEGRTAKIFLDAKHAGVMGEAHPEVLAAFGLQVPVAVFEIDAGG